MAKAFGRFVRFIQSIFVPTTAIIGFSCLLTFFFVLYQPTRGPGDIQRLGWQSWDIISPLPAADLPGGVNETGNRPPPPSEDHDTDVDWWNVTAPGSTSPADSASLPLDVWAPLLPQDTGRMSLFRPFLFNFPSRVGVLPRQCPRSQSSDACLTCPCSTCARRPPLLRMMRSKASGCAFHVISTSSLGCGTW